MLIGLSTRIITFITVTAICAAGGAIGSAALAQDTDLALARQGGIEEIVVTATKRATSLQDTPIAVTALTMNQLIKQDIRNADDLAQNVPGLNIGVTVGNTQIGLRGVSNDSFFLAGDPTVAFHVDGVYRGRQTGGNALFMDLERVEVLKGPQGTLYGRNATAGSINVISAKPKFTLGGSLQGVYGNFDRAGVRGVYNMPAVEDKLAFRLAFMKENHDGFFDNGPLIEREYFDKEEAAVRFHTLWNMSERASLLLTFDWQGRGGEGDGSQLLPEPEANLKDFINDDPYFIALNTEGDRDDEFYTGKWEFNYDFDFATLTYVGAYYDSSVFLFIDFDRRATLPQTLDVQVDSQQHSHELRLASTGTTRLEWLIGGYLFFEDAQRLLDIDIVPPGILIDNSQPNFQAESKAIFGQATYALTDTVNVTGGLRFTRDDKSEEGTVQTRQLPNGVILRGEGNQAANWDSFDWSIGVDWHPVEETMLYAKVGTGYKSGGFNDPLLDLAEPEFDPEEILAVQVGHKSQFFDGRMQMNSEAFYYDYSDLQVNQIVDALNIVRNAAEAEIYGFDTEIILIPVEAMRLDFSLQYLNAEYETFSQFDPLRDAVIDLAGKRLRQAPEWSLHAAADYTFTIANGWLLTPRISTIYETKTKHRVFDDPGATQPSYTRTNVSVTLDSPEANWQVIGFATNLENEFVATNIGLNGRNERTIRGRPPREYGVRLKYTFGQP